MQNKFFRGKFLSVAVLLLDQQREEFDLSCSIVVNLSYCFCLELPCCVTEFIPLTLVFTAVFSHQPGKSMQLVELELSFCIFIPRWCVSNIFHNRGYFLIFRNIVSTVNLGCKLDLKTIALRARNAEYNPKVSPLG